jgi:hypothetical protein
MNRRQRFGAIGAAATLLACALVPASVSNEDTAPKAEAASLYTCVLDARAGTIGNPPYQFIASTKVSCVAAYSTPRLRVSMRIYRNGTFVYKPADAHIPIRSDAPWSQVVQATSVKYYPCSKYSVYADIYAYSTGKNLGHDNVTLYTYC